MFGFIPAYLTKNFAIYGAVIAAVVAGWLYISNLKATIKADQATIAMDSAKCSNDQLAAAAASNALALSQVNVQHQSLDAAMAALYASETKSQSAGAAAVTAINQTAVLPANDAPVAPVVQQALSALRGMQ